METQAGYQAPSASKAQLTALIDQLIDKLNAMALCSPAEIAQPAMLELAELSAVLHMAIEAQSDEDEVPDIVTDEMMLKFNTPLRIHAVLSIVNTFMKGWVDCHFSGHQNPV